MNRDKERMALRLTSEDMLQDSACHLESHRLGLQRQARNHTATVSEYATPHGKLTR